MMKYERTVGAEHDLNTIFLIFFFKYFIIQKKINYVDVFSRPLDKLHSIKFQVKTPHQLLQPKSIRARKLQHSGN